MNKKPVSVISVMGAFYMLAIPAMAEVASARILNHYSDYGVVEHNNAARSVSVSIGNDPFGYSDEYTDPESGLQYLQVRYYNPIMLRFTQMDSYPLLNRYAYGNENPIMNDDPSGHSAIGSKSASDLSELSELSDEEWGEDLFNLGTGSNDFIGLVSELAAIMTEPELAVPEFPAVAVEVEALTSTIVNDSTPSADAVFDSKSEDLQQTADNNQVQRGEEPADHTSEKKVESLKKRIPDDSYQRFMNWSEAEKKAYFSLPAYDHMSARMLALPFEEGVSPEQGINLYYDQIQSNARDTFFQRLMQRQAFEDDYGLGSMQRGMQEEFDSIVLGGLDNDIGEYLEFQDAFDDLKKAGYIKNAIEPLDWGAVGEIQRIGDQ